MRSEYEVEGVRWEEVEEEKDCASLCKVRSVIMEQPVRSTYFRFQRRWFLHSNLHDHMSDIITCGHTSYVRESEHSVDIGSI